MAVAFEDLLLGVPGGAGQAVGPGLWWSATTGRHVAAGSEAMRTQLMVMDRDVTGLGAAGTAAVA